MADGVGRLPQLAPVRIGRMVADPFAFFRGTASVMAADVCPLPSSRLRVHACGDAHLLNFGLFATAERRLVFDLNDFDEAHPGAWEWDVRRLVTSVVLAGRSRAFDAAATREAAVATARRYRTRLGELAELSAIERRATSLDVDAALAAISDARASMTKDQRRAAGAVERTVARARRRDHQQAARRFTTTTGGVARIVADPPLLQPLPASDLRDQVVELYETYRSTLPHHVAAVLDEYDFADLALKVVGVGSVGTRALMALLVSRVGGGALFLQIKEAGPSVLAAFAPPGAWRTDGERVVQGQRVLQAAGDVMLGWARAGGRDYYVRQLRDMKGSFDPGSMRPSGLLAYGKVCATALANAHARSTSPAGAHPAAICGYLGNGERADDAFATFASRYADQAERDHAALDAAVRAGRLDAEPD